MPNSSLNAAKLICELGNWEITNLKLQKILYLSHMICIGKTGKPLIKEHFEAWDFGPVEPNLYHTVKFFGNKFIEFIPNANANISPDCESIIKDVFNFLKDKTAAQLVQLTHRKGGAWEKTYSENIKGLRINDSDIRQEYEKFTR